MTNRNLRNPPPRRHRSLPRLWLQYLDETVLKRSLVLTFIIGVALTLATQSSALFGNADFQRLSLALAFLTPFVVITVSQLGGTHQALSDIGRGATAATHNAFMTTLVAHNIPFRALVIALIVGSANSLLILANAFMQTGDITNAPLSLIAQVYLLPFVFGALSQALAYRRVFASPAAYALTSQENHS